MMLRIRELCRPLSPGAQCRPGQPRFEGPLGAAIETGRTRLLVLGGVFFLAFALVGGRLVDVTLLKSADPKRSAARAAAGDPDAGREHFRGEIADDKGELLATNLVTWSLYGDPKMVLDPASTAARLVRLFPELDRKQLAEKLKPSV